MGYREKSCGSSPSNGGLYILIKLKFLSFTNNNKKLAFIVLMGRLKRDSENNIVVRHFY